MTKLCPNCEAPLLNTPNEGVGFCPKCGWSGHYWRALKERTLPNPPPRMNYVSIDIETTGLDPETCQVLEVGVVFEDWKSPVDQLPSFRQVIYHREIRGEPYALALNTRLLKEISGVSKFNLPEHVCKPDGLGHYFAEWLKDHGLNPMRVAAAGKNFASFDMQFLNRLPYFTKFVKFNHRVLDPTVLYWQLEDEALPGSKTCYERAGLDGKVAHTAVEDARAVVRLIRARIHLLNSNERVCNEES